MVFKLLFDVQALQAILRNLEAQEARDDALEAREWLPTSKPIEQYWDGLNLGLTYWIFEKKSSKKVTEVEEIDQDKCGLCSDSMEDRMILKACKHKFCVNCFEDYIHQVSIDESQEVWSMSQSICVPD